ncbi:ATP-binding protein [Pedobacter sp. MC2016-15]|uniref:ATP-binding protein n=1 Tax=Pedobacter sp. MC2016-15 TaxID=2994473 RepID=UPI0022471F6A|nr:ATP-binding protein [Pedobacter sp. MC2016-15]MCX2477636.1 ATP-binding protein [Pedobacter sp. MC2016-15]
MDNTFGKNIIPENEHERIAALKRYKILGSPAENAFDHVAKLAAKIFAVPIALVSMVDTEEVFFKANVGMGKVRTTPRGISLCSLAVLDPEVTVFEDARIEPCLLANPLVAGEFGLQFYAGAPITTPDGMLIGTLCVVDKKPRTFSTQDRAILANLASIVIDEMELRLSAIEEMEKQQHLAALSSFNEQRLRDMVMSAPIGMTIMKGRDFIVEIANARMFEIWNRTEEQVLGKGILDVFPELLDQPFPEMLTEIFDTGKTISMPEIEVAIASAAGHRNIYVAFQYAPLFNAANEVDSVMATVADITDRVIARKLLEESEEELQTLNEELHATVEELAAANEEMVTTNEELTETYQNLQLISLEMELSEQRFRNMIEQSPVAMLVLRGDALIFDVVNANMLQLIDRDKDIIGMPLLSGMPEIAGQPIFDTIYEVYHTGKPYYGFEVPVKIRREGKELTGFFNVTYTPLLENGIITGILQVATEVTEQIRSRQELQRAEEMLRFSVESAQIGTWFIDLKKAEFNPSATMKQLFGYKADQPMNYAAILDRIDDESKDAVIEAVDKTVHKGDPLNVEFKVTGLNDQKSRWLRAIGKLDQDHEGELFHFSGVILEITEQKQDEIRKNDFIAMVSHELKTPLTSLKGYMQLLGVKNRNNEDGFTTTAISKGNIQITKMTAMINGFLNVSRLESGKILLQKQDFKLNQLLKETIEEIDLISSDHEFKFFPGEEITIHADQEKIGQVLNNFLTNAVKYSPQGKTIEITSKEVDGWVQVSVKDEGMGISAGDAARLFDRFYRVNSASAQNISGFGIGLYLCAEIIHRHNGKIWVDSELNQGAVFHFSLPLSHTY